MRRLLVTGVTGLVGGAVATQLLAETDWEIVVLARGRGNSSARDRVLFALQEQWGFDGATVDFARVSGRIHVIEGDVADIVPDEDLRRQLRDIRTVFHCAADVNLGKDPFGHTYLNNTNGTRRMLELARVLPSIENFQLVSTAYVAGRQGGVILEDRTYEAPVNNSYEKSKRHCEQMVREAGLPFAIYRPSIVVGRLSDGTIRKPLAFYRILEFVGKLKKHFCAKRGMAPDSPMVMPFRLQAVPTDKIYFVPIDYVQRTIATLVQRPAADKTYHVTGRAPVATEHIATVTNALLNVSGIEVMAKVLRPSRDEKLVQRFLADLLPYFSSEAHFDVTNVAAELGDASLDWDFGIEGLTTIVGSYFRSAFPALKVTLPPAGR
jgi:nucleoside-diphosphate-sugar epimerase